MTLEDNDVPQSRKLEGWRLRLLGCLALQLSHSDPSSYRTSLLLSLVARLHLNPTHGNSSHLRIICDSLNEFLRSATLSEFICETHKPALLHSLSRLECTPFTALNCKDEEDDSESDARVSTSHRKDTCVFFSEYLLHEDSDGLSVSLKDHAPTPSGDCYDLDDATLYILHDICIDHVPETHSLFESAAYSLSILPRISNFAVNNRFPDIIRNFLQTSIPDINDVNEFANWTVLASLVVRGAFVSAESEIHIERHPKSLPLLIEFTITFAKHIADGINYGLKGSMQTVNVDSGIANLFCAHVELLLRCLTWVLDATSLSLSLSVDLERKLLVCLDALSSLVQYQFVDTLRDACAIADEIFANNDSYRSTFGSFLDSFAKLPRMLFETTIEAQTTKSRDENMKKVEHTSHSLIAKLDSGICPFAYLYQLASEMVANCSSTNMLEMIMQRITEFPSGFCTCVSAISILSSLIVEPCIDQCSESILDALISHLIQSESKNMLEMIMQRIAKFPSGFCTCVSAISILSSLIVDPCIDQCSESILDALIAHLIQSESKYAANTSSPQLIDLFVKRFRNTNLLNVNYILRVLSIAYPYLSSVDAETLYEALISRYLLLKDNNACKGILSENSTLANQILLFLSANIVGQRMATSITEKILIPFIKRMDDCTDDFSHLFPLFNTVLISSSSFTSYTEQLLLALCSRMERDLSVARSDIWTLISASEFSMPLLSIVDLINAFLSRYELSVLPEALVRRLRGCSGVFLDVCLDWIQAPSGDFSHMHRIGELLALSLAVVLSCEKKSPMAQFMEQLEKDTMSSMQNPISFRLLYCLVSALFDSSMMPVVIRQYDRDCSQCQRLFSVAEHESAECRAVSRPAMCLMGIRLLADGVKRCPQLKEYDEYYVKRLCGRIRTICLMSRANLEALLAAKVIPPWLLLIENLITSSVSVGCFAAVLGIYSEFISLDAQPSQLKPLIKLIRKAPHLQLSVLETLLNVLRTNVVEPTECLAFPQNALGEIPFDVGDSKIMTANSEKEASRSSRSFELVPTKLASSLPTTSSLLSTLERFFSPSKDESKNAAQKPTNEGNQKETNKPVEVLDQQVVGRVVEGAFAAELSLGSPLNVFLSDGIGVSFWLRVDHLRNTTKVADDCQYMPVNTLHGRQIMRKRLRHSIALRQWTHVIMSLIMEHSTFSLNVTLNGHSTNLSGECRCPSDISSTPLLFSFGALKIPPKQTTLFFEMSTIFAFKGPISEQYALALRALGCGCCSLAETPSSNLYVSLIDLITASTAQTAAFSLLALLTDTKKDMARLQRAFLFVIRSSSAHSFGVSVLQPGVDAQAAVIEGGGSVLGLTMLKDYPIYWRCRIAQRQISSIEHSLIPLGSVQLVLLLFAQTVDMHSECIVQSAAFRLLMTFARRTSTSMGEFVRSSGYAVVARCLSSPLASIDTPIVNEILRWSISELEEQESDVAKPTPSSIIIDPDLICSLVCCADIWRGEGRFIHWLHLAEALAVCLSDTFARCFAFNRGQLIRVGFLTELFNTCNEMLQNANDFRMEHNNAVRLVKSLSIAISCLLGSPESTEAVTFLWHFILLSHPAADAFLQYQVHGHNDWIKNESLKELRIDVIGGHSALAMRLDDYARHIADAWTRQRSLMALRHAYEAAVGMDPSKTHDAQLSSGHPDSDPQYCSVLPDLVKGIETRATAEEENVTVEESDDERSQSSVKFFGDPQTEWISALRCGAIELLSVVTQNGPDSLILAFLHDAISWQSIIVLLSNQDDISFRNSVFILLENVLLRSPSSVRASFVKNHGFAILANHIRGHTITSSIANALFALLCGETVRLDEGLDSDHLQSAYVDNFTCSSFEAILAMWEECVTAADLSLFWNPTLSSFCLFYLNTGLATFFLQVYEANSLLMQAMMDAHLCDALANVLRRIALLPPLETDIESVSAWSPLLECWSSLAKRVIITCVPYNDAHHYEMCQRLIWLLEYELLAFSSNSVNEGYAGDVVRKELCSLLSCWLLTLQNVYVDEGLSASAAPSTESISSQSPAFAFRDEHIEDIESEGIPSSLASSLQGVSPMASFFTESFTNLRERISSIGDQMKCRYRWRHRMQLPSPSESANRVLFCIEACSNLFTAIPSSSAEIISEHEEALFQYFISFLLSTWKKDQDVIAMRCGASSRAQAWAHLLSACRDRARLLLGQLIAFVLFPAEHKIGARMSSTCSTPAFERNRWSIRKRLALVHSLANDLPYKNTLKTLLDINLDYQYAMNLTLHELALVDDCLDADSARDVEKLVRFLRNLQIESPLANLTPERIMSLTTDETLALHEYVDHRNGFMLALCERVTALYEEERRASEPVSNTAMSLTCEVVEEQNLSRKLFLRSCHRAETSNIYAERIISSLSAQLCHPEAVCFDESSWPLSWALDPTEGPNRERRRLKADHLNFDKRFVLPEFAKNLDNRERPFPLANLLAMEDEQAQRDGA
uniref:Non-specific serine/threonine protein kinase n=1 Tax=Ascaris lumbricoides TaxID=6252 RepID=A0A0M3I439_ASCLU